MHPIHANAQHLTRRSFLSQTGAGVGLAALASRLRHDLPSADQVTGRVDGDRCPGVVRAHHVPPKAKRVIYLYMAGGPSHLETLDYKPKLAQMHDTPMPESLTK